MNTVLLGNLIAIVGCLMMVGVGFIREKKTILTVQCFQFGIMGAANLILGGTTGFIANFVSIVRNLVFDKKENTTPLKVFFLILQVLLSLKSLSGGWIAWLPILATCVYTWFLDTKSAVRLKLVMILAQLMWLVYDLHFSNYVSAAFDTFTVISTVIGIAMIKRTTIEK